MAATKPLPSLVECSSDVCDQFESRKSRCVACAVSPYCRLSRGPCPTPSTEFILPAPPYHGRIICCDLRVLPDSRHVRPCVLLVGCRFATHGCVAYLQQSVSRQVARPHSDPHPHVYLHAIRTDVKHMTTTSSSSCSSSNSEASAISNQQSRQRSNSSNQTPPHLHLASASPSSQGVRRARSGPTIPASFPRPLLVEP